MITIGPELHIAHVQDVKAQLVEALRNSVASAEPMSLDCSGLQSFDAAGLQLLVALAMSQREHGKSVHLCACPAVLRQRIQSVALHDWFEFESAEVV